jgi:tetraacyldisaccharide 4'-kinase
MRIIQFILLPASLCYGLMMMIRNLFFDMGILRRESFDIPVISVGNLSMGGTGKTPHIEYLIRLLKDRFRIATLSRGYGRKSNGFIMATHESDVSAIGDEPLQYFRKFSGIKVAVDEKRKHGIHELLKKFPELNAVLLDDAYQHRYVKPGLSILLTDYHLMYPDDYVVPSGTLREFRYGAHRADIIIVTKTPKIFSPITRRKILEDLKPGAHQKIFFSYLTYGDPVPVFNGSVRPFPSKIISVLLFTGIANDYPLKEHLSRYCSDIKTMKFPDHHHYTMEDIEAIKKAFHDLPTQSKVIVTTEKDVMRVKTNEFTPVISQLPLFYLPIQIEFHEKDKAVFNAVIVEYVSRNYMANLT